MRRGSFNEGHSQPEGIQATPSSAHGDGLLVRSVVFCLRTLLVFFVAFARAVVIIAGDDVLLNQILETTLPSYPSSLFQPIIGKSGPDGTQVSDVTAPSQEYLVVFVGRDVGYTISCVLADSFVQDVPKGHTKRFNSFDEAVQAYTIAVQHGNVYRVRTAIQPSGHVEFVNEYLNVTAGIRDLDYPQLSPRPLITTALPPELPPPTPCNSIVELESNDGAVAVEVSALPASEPSSRAIPDHREGSADAVIISTASMLPNLDNDALRAPTSMTVIILDSDDDSVNSSIIGNVSDASTHSAHSSDIYYADKRYDAAIAAYVEEDNKIYCTKTFLSASGQTE